MMRKFQTPYHYWPSEQALAPAAPCPFCKSPNVMMNDMAKAVSMTCVDCGAEGPMVSKRSETMYPHRYAWERWNYSAASADLAGMVKK